MTRENYYGQVIGYMQKRFNESPNVHVAEPSLHQYVYGFLTIIYTILYCKLALGSTSTEGYLSRVQEPS